MYCNGSIFNETDFKFFVHNSFNSTKWLNIAIVSPTKNSDKKSIPKLENSLDYVMALTSHIRSFKLLL